MSEERVCSRCGQTTGDIVAHLGGVLIHRTVEDCVIALGKHLNKMQGEVRNASTSTD